MKKNTLFLLAMFTVSVFLMIGCKKKHEEPAPVTGTSTTNTTPATTTPPPTTTTPTVPPITTTIGIGNLTFQDTTTTLAGGCANTAYGYLMGGSDSTNALAVLFIPAKPSTNQTIDLASASFSPKVSITSGSDFWLATSGTLSVSVYLGHVAVRFSNATFTNNNTGATTLASGSIICE
jgi:hypothetical protein